VIGRSTVVATV